MSKKPKALARVTSVLGWLDSAWKEYWWKKVGFEAAERVSRESQEVGKKVHSLIERYVRGDHSELPPTREGVCASHVIQWLAENRVKPLYIEQELIDKALGLVGHCDLIAEIDSENVILDYKTSKKVSRSYSLQLAAYAFMANKQLKTQITKGIILRVDKDPDAKQQLEVIEYKPLKPYWAVFKAGLIFYKFMLNK